MSVSMCGSICACVASRETEECHCSVRMVEEMMRNACDGIYEHPVDHILNKYKIILLLSLRVMQVFLHIYFGDYEPQFSTI